MACKEMPSSSRTTHLNLSSPPYFNLVDDTKDKLNWIFKSTKHQVIQNTVASTLVRKQSFGISEKYQEVTKELLLPGQDFL